MKKPSKNYRIAIVIYTLETFSEAEQAAIIVPVPGIKRFEIPHA